MAKRTAVKNNNLNVTVIKRDGREVPFNINQIDNAIKAAYDSVNKKYDKKILNKIIQKIQDIMSAESSATSTTTDIVTSDTIAKVAATVADTTATTATTVDTVATTADTIKKIQVEKIQDIIEDILLQLKEKEVAKSYIRYRAKRTQLREANSNLITLFSKIHNLNAEQFEILRDNANVNGNSMMGLMLKLGTESNKYFLLNHFLKQEYSQAHKEGYLHIHDLDFSNIGLNCLQLNLEKLFKNGFSTGHGYLREPNSIRAYTALAAISLQSQQNDQFGGVSINLFDFYMAPGIKKSFIKAFKHNLIIAQKTILKNADVFNDYIEKIDTKTWDNEGVTLPSYNDKTKLNDIIEYFSDEADEIISFKAIVKAINFAYAQAVKDVEEETHQAMEALVFNLNTLNSRAGSQVPFSSLNLGLDTSEEGRLVTKELLNAIYDGLGKHETSIFPIVVFQLKKGFNYELEDKNYDLFKLAIKCSAKRLFPTYMNEDAPYNAQYYHPGNIQTFCATMGCRTRVMGNINGPEESGSRGNFAFVTVNLPMLAIEAQHDISKFFELYDHYIQLAHDYLLERFKLICQKHVYNYPFMMGEHTYMNSDHLKPNDTIFEAIKNASLSIGFVGLAECLTALTGKHHGEDEKSQKLGLAIVAHLRVMTDKYIQQDHLNWSTFSTPAESCAGRMLELTKKRYGVIPGVTDKDYFTNSMHIPVGFNIPAAQKIQLEAPYHQFCNAGVISYIEFDGDATKNLKAFESVIRYMHDMNMNYFAINTKSADYCPQCGNASFIDKACPICGYHEHVDNQHYAVNFNINGTDLTGSSTSSNDDDSSSGKENIN